MSHDRLPALSADELRAADRLFAVLRAQRVIDVTPAPAPAAETARPPAHPLAEAS